MPLVHLLIAGDYGPASPIAFDVAPSPGAIVVLRDGDVRHHYRVEQIFHGLADGGKRMLCFALLDSLLEAEHAPPDAPVAQRFGLAEK